MAYTAIEAMRKKNRERFGADLGPRQPTPGPKKKEGMDLPSAALRFLRESCEELLFDGEREREERCTGVLQGRSHGAGEIPFNMERDLDRLCLEKALEEFIASGTAEDAYTVYYCYLEMFLGRYGNYKRMVELLSEARRGRGAGRGLRQRGFGHRLCQAQPPGPLRGRGPLGKGVRSDTVILE